MEIIWLRSLSILVRNMTSPATSLIRAAQKTSWSGAMKYLGLMLAACLSISYPARLPAASKPDEAHVRDVIANLMRAWNVHDMHAFADQFTDDGSFVNVNGSWLRNATQIEESHKVVHSTIFKASNAVITPAQVRLPQPDVAVVHAKWQITGDSRRPEPRDYVMTLVLRRQSGVWKVLAAQNGSAEDRSGLGFANLRVDDAAPIPAAERSGNCRIARQPTHPPPPIRRQRYGGLVLRDPRAQACKINSLKRYLACKQNLEEPVNDRFGCLFYGDVDSRDGLLTLGLHRMQHGNLLRVL
jgi:uncharacterized protein (TIGR02246 family)